MRLNRLSLDIQRVVVGEGARDYPLTSSVLRNLSGVPVTETSKTEGPLELMGDKTTLELAVNKGAVLKPCPGTRGYICCGYQILNVATNCPLDCAYCVLQAYFQENHVKCFVNIFDYLKLICKQIDDQPWRIFRVGTGEFTDSLALDPIMGWTELLIPPFSKRKNAVLEFKTKTVAVEGLLRLGERKNVVLAWSLNSPYMISREEHRVAGLRERLQAAKRCQSEGYVLGFHFDPMVCHDAWEEGYLRAVEMLDAFLKPEGIIWISLGSLRFMPSLKPILRKRHPRSCVLDGELVRGLDGKMRYFKPIRIELYARMKELLDAWSRDLGLYLCMESDDVWRQSFGWSPGCTEGLSHYLDGRASRFFG